MHYLYEVEGLKAAEAPQALLKKQREGLLRDNFTPITFGDLVIPFSYLDEEGRECIVDLTDVVGLHPVLVMPVPQDNKRPFCLVVNEENTITVGNQTTVPNSILFDEAFEDLRIPSVKLRYGRPGAEATVILPYAEERYVTRALSVMSADGKGYSIIDVQRRTHAQAQAELERTAARSFLDRDFSTRAKTTIGEVISRAFQATQQEQIQHPERFAAGVRFKEAARVAAAPPIQAQQAYPQQQQQQQQQQRKYHPFEPLARAGHAVAEASHAVAAYFHLTKT